MKRIYHTLGQNKLNTDVLPKYNCSNCEFFINGKQELGISITNENIAIECSNLVHPLSDCILRGFEGHSEQPGFSQTINKKK